MKMLFLIRGIPGTGKTELAKRLAGYNVCENDMYFYRLDDGAYRFNSGFLVYADEYCRQMCEAYMKNKFNDVVAVANPFIRKSEMQPYYELADKYGYAVQVVVCQGAFELTHHISKKTIAHMKEQFEW